MITFEQTEYEFGKLTGLPIKKVFRSFSLYLLIHFGEMHLWRMKNSKTGEMIEGEDGDFTLTLEGQWIYKSADGQEIKPKDPQLIEDEEECVRYGKRLDAQIEKFKFNYITEILFNDNDEYIKFVFNDHSSITVFHDEVGMLILNNTTGNYSIFFDPKEGIFYKELTEVKNPASQK